MCVCVFVCVCVCGLGLRLLDIVGFGCVSGFGIRTSISFCKGQGGCRVCRVFGPQSAFQGSRTRSEGCRVWGFGLIL